MNKYLWYGLKDRLDSDQSDLQGTVQKGEHYLDQKSIY